MYIEKTTLGKFMKPEILYVKNNSNAISIISDNSQFLFLYDKLLKKTYVRTNHFSIGMRANQHFWTIVGYIIRNFKADTKPLLTKCEWNHSSKKVNYIKTVLSYKDFDKFLMPLMERYDNSAYPEFCLRHTDHAALTFFTELQKLSGVMLRGNKVTNVVIENSTATVYFEKRIESIVYLLSEVDITKMDYYIPRYGLVIDMLLGIGLCKTPETKPVETEVDVLKIANSLIKPIDLTGADLSFLTAPVAETPLSDLLNKPVDYEAVFYKLLRIVSGEGNYKLLIDEIGNGEDFFEITHIGLNIETKNFYVGYKGMNMCREGKFSEILPLLKLSKLDYIPVEFV